MSEMFEAAREKIERESKEGKYDRYANAMKGEVKKALLSFVKQDEELAQAVVQGGSFAECMAYVAKGCGSHISDLAAFEKAVQFYFPGARVRYQMEVDLVGDAALSDAAEPRQLSQNESQGEGKATERKPAGKILDLSDFL